MAFLLLRSDSETASASVPETVLAEPASSELPVIDEHVRLGTPISSARVPAPKRLRASVPPVIHAASAPAIPAPPEIQPKPVEFPAYAIARPAPERPRVPLHSRPAATVVLEQVKESLPRRAISRIPLINRIQTREFKAGDRFIAARPVRETTPFVPPAVRSRISGIVPVDLRISIDKRGAVAETELLSRKVDSALASIAVQTASRWDFIPARIGNRPVSSEMLVHMRFGEAR